MRLADCGVLGSPKYTDLFLDIHVLFAVVSGTNSASGFPNSDGTDPRGTTWRLGQLRSSIRRSGSSPSLPDRCQPFLPPLQSVALAATASALPLQLGRKLIVNTDRRLAPSAGVRQPLQLTVRESSGAPACGDTPVGQAWHERRWLIEHTAGSICARSRYNFHRGEIPEATPGSLSSPRQGYAICVTLWNSMSSLRITARDLSNNL